MKEISTACSWLQTSKLSPHRSPPSERYTAGHCDCLQCN
jgi:hypothetical protein